MTIFITGCSAQGFAGEVRSEKFSFTFRYRPCGPNDVDVLDTASETFIYTPLGATSSIPISLRLTDTELDAIYQKILSIRFFDYPSEFDVPEIYVVGYAVPAATYSLSVTNGKIAHSVKWTDDAISAAIYTRADQLRELMNLIQQTIESHPEIKQLPEPTSFCL
jgi:hypothetical protein